MKNMLIAQSGGPTAAINASLSGAIQGAVRSGQIEGIYGSLNGIQGVLEEKLVDLRAQFRSPQDFSMLETTPAMALGSCRVRLPEPESDPAIYKKILQTFQKFDIGFFFYIGGNDSMDTVDKLSRFFAQNEKPIRVVGIPKTIDNDLPATDHSPGFGSAAKFIATSMLEIIRDCYVYDTTSVTIVEIMGRNAGWLTAAAALPRTVGAQAPHLLYLPETTFDPERFITDIQKVHRTHKNCIIAVSEGIRLSDGSFAAEGFQSGVTDVFGHRYLAGTGKYLETLVREKIGCKVRSVELNVLQRCAGHILSATDIEEAKKIGMQAVETALAGETGVMMVLRRVSENPYRAEAGFVPVRECANKEQLVPLNWICENGSDITDDLYAYLLPLVKGELSYPTQNGMPQHFVLDKTLLVKK